MAYDEELAARVRERLAGENVREQKMFGGLSFMVDDKLAVNAGHDGNLLVRVDSERADELVAEPGAEQAEMRGRRMGPGWLRVAREAVDAVDALDGWIDAALAYNRQVAGRDA